MCIKKNFNLNILISLFMIACVVGYAKDKSRPSIQGIEMIEGLKANADSLLWLVQEEQFEEAKTRFNGINRLWEDFLPHHIVLFESEVEKTETITNEIDEVNEAINFIKENIDKRSSVQISKSLEAIQRSLKNIEIKITKPVMLCFTGFSCRKCMVMKPRVEKMAREFLDRIRIAFINVNIESKLPKQYEIKIVPTMVFIDKNGNEIFRKSGEIEEKILRVKLENLVK